MTVEEVFSDLYERYGRKFCWHLIPLSQSSGAFVARLKKEIGKEHFLYDKRIWAVAMCESRDDVLYVTGSGDGRDIYYIFHFSGSEHDPNRFPVFEEFPDIHGVKAFIEQSYMI